MKESTRPNTRRSRGEGSVYRTAEGRWRAALTIGGARRVISGRTRSAVVAKLDALKRDAGAGVYAGRLTVADYLTRWLEAERQRLRASTWRERESHIRLYIGPAIGAIPLSRLTPLDVERMTAALVERGLSPRTAAHVRVSLRRALGDAMRDGLIARNVAALARPPRVPGRSLEAGRDYLDPADLRRLLSESRLHPVGPLVALAATTGLRLGELLGLAWSDIGEGTLTVRRSLARAYDGGWEMAEPKTPRSRRTIHLPATASAALDRQRALQNVAHIRAAGAWQRSVPEPNRTGVQSDRIGLVFTDAVGRPMSGSHINHVFHALLGAAGLPSIPFHGLRHSAATAMLAGGVPLKVVSDTLGHSTIAITADTYAGVVPEQRRDAADAMERALGGAS